MTQDEWNSKWDLMSEDERLNYDPSFNSPEYRSTIGTSPVPNGYLPIGSIPLTDEQKRRRDAGLPIWDSRRSQPITHLDQTPNPITPPIQPPGWNNYREPNIQPPRSTGGPRRRQIQPPGSNMIFPPANFGAPSLPNTNLLGNGASPMSPQTDQNTHGLGVNWQDMFQNSGWKNKFS